LELIFPDAAQSAFDLKTRLSQIRRLGKALFRHCRSAAIHEDTAAHMEAVGMVQRFDGEAMAEIDKERQRRTFGAVFCDQDRIAAAGAPVVGLSAQFLFLAVLPGDFLLELLQALRQRRDLFDLRLEKTNFLGRIVRQRGRRRRRENDERQSQKRCLPGPKLRFHCLLPIAESRPCSRRKIFFFFLREEGPIVYSVNTV